MTIETINVKYIEENRGQVQGLPANPRKISKAKLQALRKSIEDAPEMLSLRELIVYPQGNKYVVVGGNMRLRACKEIGYEDLPCKVLEADTPAEKLREYAIKDNVAFGEEDWDVLADWDVEELKEWGMELSIDLADSKHAEGVGEVEEDVFDEHGEEIKPLCKLGDIWKLGAHRLMCGDSTNAEDVAKLMNDDLRGDNLYNFLKAAFVNLAKHLKRGGAFYVWFASSNHIQFESALKSAGLKVKQELIWDKGMVLGHSDYHWAYEPCLYGCHADKNSTWYGDRTQKTFLQYNKTDIRKLNSEQMEEILLNLHDGRTVWRISRDNVQDYIHPTQKPLALAGMAMRNSSTAKHLVLDLFGGSGSTMMAAEQLDRRCCMMEYDPHYCDVIIARYEKLTGKRAEKIME